MSWARRAFSLRERRGRLALLVSIVLIVAALIALEALLLALSAPPATGTITGAQLKYVDEGVSPFGGPWFGAEEINYSGVANGYPYSFPVGSTFNFSVEPSNNDNASHAISQILVNPPFRVAGTYPALPYEVEANDDFLLMIDFGTPSTPGTYSLNVTVVVGS